MASWKIPELNGGFNREITYRWSIFQQATFDYRRVSVPKEKCCVTLWDTNSASKVSGIFREETHSNLTTLKLKAHVHVN